MATTRRRSEQSELPGIGKKGGGGGRRPVQRGRPTKAGKGGAPRARTAGAPVAAERLQSREGRWSIARTSAQGFHRREGEIPVRTFVAPPCYVGVRYATTVGDPGSYSSERVEVSLSMPCYPAEIADIYQDVSRWVGQRLTEEREALLALRSQRGAA